MKPPLVGPAPHLEQFLRDLVEKGGFATVHVIAHSMGNRAVAAALESIARDRPANRRSCSSGAHGPDIDAKNFEQLAKIFLTVAKRVDTLRIRR
jgi:esterase/lipase superfamily enzyme